MPTDQFFQAGITALNSGDFEGAAKLFAQVVKADPNSEQGWLLLGKCVPGSDQKKYCFERVLGINPDNTEVHQNLEQLLTPKETTPRVLETFVDKPADPDQSLRRNPVFSPQSQTDVAPLIFDQHELIANDQAGLEPISILPIGNPQREAKNLARDYIEPVHPFRKKKKTIFPLFLWLIPLLLLCGGITGYLVLSGTWQQLIPADMIPLFSPTSRAGPSHPTPTYNVRQVPTASPTNAGPTIVPTPLPTVPYVPTFKVDQCKFDHPVGVTVSCGYLTVPEDRTDPASPTIQIAVAVFHSTNPNPTPDPVIFLQGGPGGEAIMTSVSAYDILIAPFLDKRDYIAFDQRGTGLTKPAINCPELETVSRQDMFGQIPASSRNMIYTNAFRSCHGMLTVSGIGLNDFNTIASADDLKDMVVALGYDKVNLYSASYGTRLALVTMRNHPEILRSVVLDSVVPVEARLYYEDPQRYNSDLRAHFDGC
jgi:pimeloyl-ACP methyl ester carboxylesterase